MTSYLGSLNVNINFGIKTGFNNAFIVPEDTKNSLIDADPKNAQILKPVLRGRDIQKFTVNFSKLWIINSHNGRKSQGIPRINVAKDFPTVFEYFSQYQEQLEKRQDKGEHWTNLRNCAYINEFDKPKILWGELADAPKFAYDENGFYPEATLFFMTGEKLKYLLAILNSKLGEWYFDKISTTSGMGTNRWKKYKIEQLPIPVALPEEEQQIEHLVDYILWANADLQQNPSPEARLRTDYLEQVINGLVYELYLPEQLTEAKLTVFEHLGELPPLEVGLEEAIVESVFQRLFDKKHPVRNALFYLRAIPEVRVILERVNRQKYDPSLIKWEDEHEHVS